MGKKEKSLRKDKPYLPLYVQDVLSDERLINCSASAHGIYFLLLCILHKQETYGVLLLKQKHKQMLKQKVKQVLRQNVKQMPKQMLKQNVKQIEIFACYLANQMPFVEAEIYAGLMELFEEGVIKIEGDKLYQKRMVNDYLLRSKRAKAGRIGGEKTAAFFAKALAKARVQANARANPDIDIDIENDIEIDNDIDIDFEKKIEKINSK